MKPWSNLIREKALIHFINDRSLFKIQGVKNIALSQKQHHISQNTNIEKNIIHHFWQTQFMGSTFNPYDGIWLITSKGSCYPRHPHTNVKNNIKRKSFLLEVSCYYEILNKYICLNQYQNKYICLNQYQEWK